MNFSFHNTDEELGGSSPAPFTTRRSPRVATSLRSQGKSSPTKAQKATAATGNGMMSDRLQKAIARNRSKQIKRENKTQPPPIRPQLLQKRRVVAAPNSRAQSYSRGASTITVKNPNALLSKIKSPSFFKRIFNREKKPVLATATVSRSKAVIKAPLKKAPVRKRAQAPASPFQSDSKVARFALSMAVKTGWLASVALLAQLFFSERGVLDYYEKKEVWQEKVFESEFIISENLEIKNEINLIDEDGRYQKKLVRDNLGFIAEDEFLILFSRGKVKRPI